MFMGGPTPDPAPDALGAMRKRMTKMMQGGYGGRGRAGVSQLGRFSGQRGPLRGFGFNVPGFGGGRQSMAGRGYGGGEAQGGGFSVGRQAQQQLADVVGLGTGNQSPNELNPNIFTPQGGVSDPSVPGGSVGDMSNMLSSNPNINYDYPVGDPNRLQGPDPTLVAGANQAQADQYYNWGVNYANSPNAQAETRAMAGPGAPQQGQSQSNLQGLDPAILAQIIARRMGGV